MLDWMNESFLSSHTDFTSKRYWLYDTVEISLFAPNSRRLNELRIEVSDASWYDVPLIPFILMSFMIGWYRRHDFISPYYQTDTVNNESISLFLERRIFVDDRRWSFLPPLHCTLIALSTATVLSDLWHKAKSTSLINQQRKKNNDSKLW